MVRFMIISIPYMDCFMVSKIPYMIPFTVSKIPCMVRFMVSMITYMFSFIKGKLTYMGCIMQITVLHVEDSLNAVKNWLFRVSSIIFFMVSLCSRQINFDLPCEVTAGISFYNYEKKFLFKNILLGE